MIAKAASDGKRSEKMSRLKIAQANYKMLERVYEEEEKLLRDRQAKAWPNTFGENRSARAARRRQAAEDREVAEQLEDLQESGSEGASD